MDAKRNRIGARAVNATKALGLAVGFGVENKIDVALAVQGDIFAAVAGNRGKAEPGKQLGQFGGMGRGVFNKLEAVGTQRVVP